jgi:hypothetical protein
MADAEDIVQECFLTLLKPDCSGTPFVAGICPNYSGEARGNQPCAGACKDPLSSWRPVNQRQTSSDLVSATNNHRFKPRCEVVDF